MSITENINTLKLLKFCIMLKVIITLDIFFKFPNNFNYSTKVISTAALSSIPSVYVWQVCGQRSNVCGFLRILRFFNLIISLIIAFSMSICNAEYTEDKYDIRAYPKTCP